MVLGFRVMIQTGMSLKNLSENTYLSVPDKRPGKGHMNRLDARSTVQVAVKTFGVSICPAADVFWLI